ncbi:MAG: YdeI/OmpD-associated family protein [bacterium]|nr:YdeI/OmpD-associated family protein [bacterium]
MTEHPLQFTFVSQVLFDPTVADGYMKHYVPIPDAVADALTDAGIKHVEGRLDEVAFRRVVHLQPDGTRCLKFGKIWLEQAGLDVLSEVMVELAPDHDPDRVDIPDELAAELQAEPELMQRWDTLAPSRRKTLVYDIERAKRPETRQKRTRAVVDELRKLIDLSGR